MKTNKDVVLARSQAAFINSVSSEEADKLLVAMMANRMECKLGVNRNRGRSGWHTTEILNHKLEDLLYRCAERQDWIDVAIVAGMILVRQEMGQQ